MVEIKFCSVIVAESFQHAKQNIASMHITIAIILNGLAKKIY
jgi:hypothetical protein